MIQEHIEDVRCGKIDIVSYVKQALQSVKDINSTYSYFTVISEELAISQAKQLSKKIKSGTAPGKLAGLLVSIKDNICVQGVETTATSKILTGYKPVFNATIIERLLAEDAIIIGKTSCDAFGFGSFNTNVGLDYEIPKNPIDVSRVTGGSSGGSAGITAKIEFAHVSIAESTGGSIENPASFCGVVGFCPTYGKVSRYGLISYANSLDKIGIMSKDTSDIAPVFEVISGFDEKDGTSLKEQKLSSNIKTKKISELRIGLIKESMDKKGIHEDIIFTMNETISKLKQTGATVETVSLPITFTYGIPTYYLLSTAEASTNLAKLSGLRYGVESKKKNKFFSDYFTEIRSSHFNTESKRRILLGTFARMAGFRDAYYIKAAKVRTKIIEEYKKQFQKYDILISPTMPITAPNFDEVKKLTPAQNFMLDILTVGPNLAGVPHASIPIGNDKQNMPIGLMASSAHHNEKTLLTFLAEVEKL